jgi:hypothetical protein
LFIRFTSCESELIRPHRSFWDIFLQLFNLMDMSVASEGRASHLVQLFGWRIKFRRFRIAPAVSPIDVASLI